MCQLAAIHGTDEINVCIINSHRISPSAAAVNKLSFKNGRIFYDEKSVAAAKLDVAIGCKALNYHTFHLHTMLSCLMSSIFKGLLMSPTRPGSFKNWFLGDWYRPSLKVDVFFRLLFRQFNFMQF